MTFFKFPSLFFTNPSPQPSPRFAGRGGEQDYPLIRKAGRGLTPLNPYKKINAKQNLGEALGSSSPPLRGSRLGRLNFS
jgi:hypothetical protein